MSSRDDNLYASLKRKTALARYRRLKILVLFLPLLLLSACTTLGPDFQKPTAQIEDQWAAAREQGIKAESADVGQWWTVFNDPVLNHLIDLAGEQNLSVRIAGLRILEARARLGIAVGLQYPQPQSLNGGYSFLKSSKNAPPLSSLPDTVRDQVDTSTDVYRFGFDAAWELDFWGKFRRAVEAADADLAAAIADHDNLLVMLTGEVAGAYTLIRTLEQRVAYANNNVDIQDRGLRVADANFKGGMTSELDVQQALSLLRNTQASIPVLEIAIRQAKHGLSILLGMPPSDLKTILTGPSAIPTAPLEVAVGIPADLIRRRPDIHMAEYRAAAQGALIGVAQADLYPHFALAGSIGFSAGNGANLFDSDSYYGFFSPFTFKWDILNYGRIKNRVRVQDARFQQLLVAYQNKVLQAAKEVEDGLIGFVKSRRQTEFLEDAVKAAQRATDIALLQYKEGLVDYTRVLNTQQSLVLHQDQLASGRGDIVRYLIATYKALGGGWQIRSGKPLLPSQIVETMRNRTDWGQILKSADLPTENKVPPTGKAVKVFNKPIW